MLTNIIPTAVWTERAAQHLEIVTPYADAFLKRRKLGQTSAVHDFLFTYYSCSPAKLKKWVPSIHEILEITPEQRVEYPWLDDYWFIQEGNQLFLNKNLISKSTFGLVGFVATLCENISKRAPRFGCFGLHEWAMVYKLSPENLRHQGRSLRLSSGELERFVETQSICCSHYDAYRFFTEESRPLNILNPTIEKRLEMEQGGCIHANMDIYKWSIKLWPWIGSDFLAKAFLLALEGRELDMRASPYDLKNEGYEPICIETEEGRKAYQREQLAYAERASILRNDLYTFCKDFPATYVDGRLKMINV